jgi:hypothetical protein
MISVGVLIGDATGFSCYAEADELFGRDPSDLIRYRCSSRNTQVVGTCVGCPRYVLQRINSTDLGLCM